jgi:arylsulfatase A-like enzyme/Flp pilus assembly protein TadD
MRRARLPAVPASVLLAVSLFASSGCARPPTPPPPATKPNVLLVTLDTTRADHLGAYGYASAATPNLDRLAASGVRFDQALSSVPLTLPSHASLMTGRQPYSHGVRNNGHFRLAPDVPTLAEAFAAGGYDTAAFVSSFVLDRQFGLDRGFAHYDAALDPAGGGTSSLELERRGDRTVAAASGWLAARTSTRPLFLWVHLYDPHDPYVPPLPFRERFTSAPYDGEIAFDDALVGTLLDNSGYRRSSTLVVVAGDHGESLGEHGESTHGLFVYESALRVPLIMAGAGISAPSVVTEPVRLIDVAPTIAAVAGVALQPADGRSLRPLLDKQPMAEDSPPGYAETYFPQFFMGWSPLRSMRAGRWKYIDAPTPELYDLAADPAERTNVIEREQAAAASLERALKSTVTAATNRMTPTPLSEDARQRLASLGYVSAVTPPPQNDAAVGADPKTMVGVFEQLLGGNRALASGRPDEAAKTARAVTAQDPKNAFAQLLLGRAALAQGRNREAMAAFKAYLALVPRSADAHHWTALAALRLGDRKRALAEEEAALALDPRLTNAIALRAGLLLSAGRADEAVALLRDAIQRDPPARTLVIELADVLADARRFPEAEDEYRKVLESQPRDGRALTGLGLVLAATDRLDAALEPLNRAVEADERNEEARMARAEVFARLGRTAESRADYEKLAQTALRPDLRQAARRALAAGRD